MNMKIIITESQYQKLMDDKVGEQMWFEYHCFESEKSCDKHLWKRSHQLVNILDISEMGGGDTMYERLNNGEPRVYRIEFDDGLVGDAFEDELMLSPEEFIRPDPPLF